MPKERRNKARKVWRNVHISFGLVVGLLFVLTGLTGSLLVFYIEIDEWLNPEITFSSTEESWRSYEDMLQALRTAHPTRKHAWRLEVPSSQERMITARFYKPEETADISFAPLMVWVNPHTVEIVSSRLWGTFPMTWLYNLHYRLLLDMTGKTLLTFVGVCILFSLGTGVYLWWPTTRNLRLAFTLQTNGSTKRMLYDLHKLNGIYALIFLLIVVATGTLLAFPWVEPMVGSISQLYEPPRTDSVSKQASTRISVDQAVAIGQARFPDARVKWIETPNGPTGSYRINLWQQGEPSRRFPKTNVWIDQYTGYVLSVRDVKHDSAGDTFLRWLHPLHSGQVLGLPGRILVCLSGVIPLVLYVTGFTMWWRRRKINVYAP